MAILNRPSILALRRRTFEYGKAFFRTRSDPLTLALRSRMGHGYVRLGRVSIIVPIYNVEEYLAECLDSIRMQTYPDLEVLMIDDGSTDGSRDIARRYARRDRRFRLITQPNGGLGAARNTGVAHATGRYLTFIDSDDEVSREAIRLMVEMLAASGSDFVSGGIERWTEDGRWRDDWVTRVHGRDRAGLTIDDLPEAVKDVFACNKLYRTEFFARAIGAFPLNVLHEDQEPAALAYTSCTSFDVLAETTYFWRIRADGSSITQARLRQNNLDDRIAVAQRVAQVYERASTAVQRYRWQDFVGDDLAQYYRVAWQGDDEYWGTLSAFVADLFGSLPADLWDGVAVRERCLAAAVASGDRSTTETLVAAFETAPHGVPVTVDPAGSLPRVDLSVFGLSPTALPARITQLSKTDTALRTGLTRIAWEEDGSLTVTGFAYRQDLPLQANDTELFANLIGEHGSVIPLQVDRFTFAQDSLYSPVSSFCAWPESGFTLRVPVAEVLGAEDAAVIQLRLVESGVACEAILRPQDIENIPNLPPFATRQGKLLRVAADRADGVRLLATSSPVFTRDLSCDGRVVSFEIVAAEDLSGGSIVCNSHGTGMLLRASDIPPLQAGRVRRIEIALPQTLDQAAARLETQWELHFESTTGQRTALPYPHGSQAELASAAAGAPLALGATQDGGLMLHERFWTARVSAVTATESGISVSGSMAMAAVQPPRLILLAPDGEQIPTESFTLNGLTGAFTARFALAAKDFVGAQGNPRIFGLCLVSAEADTAEMPSQLVFWSPEHANGVRQAVTIPDGVIEATDLGFDRSVLLFDRSALLQTTS